MCAVNCYNHHIIVLYQLSSLLSYPIESFIFSLYLSFYQLSYLTDSFIFFFIYSYLYLSLTLFLYLSQTISILSINLCICPSYYLLLLLFTIFLLSIFKLFHIFLLLCKRKNTAFCILFFFL